MQTRRYKLTSTGPMLHHNGQLANPLNPFAKKLKILTANRKKTDEDHLEISRWEFAGGLYRENDVVVIPADVMRAAFLKSGRGFKLGKQIESAVRWGNEGFPLKYEGPQDPNELFDYEDKEGNHIFVKTRNVRVGQNTIPRTRPIFDKWTAEVELTFNEDIMDNQMVTPIMERCGQEIRIGDGRVLGYGSFTVKEVK